MGIGVDDAKDCLLVVLDDADNDSGEDARENAGDPLRSSPPTSISVMKDDAMVSEKGYEGYTTVQRYENLKI